MQKNHTAEQDLSHVNPQKQQKATSAPTARNTKFCKHCGGKIPYDAVLCTLCGRLVEELTQPKIIINNDKANTTINIHIV